MAEKLHIDGAEKEFELVNDKNGATVNVLIAIYDVFLIGRIMEVADELDKLQDKMYAQSPAESADNAAYIAFYHAAQDIDREMRNAIDGLFDAPVCDTLFPRQSMFALGNGAPTWANILVSVIENMDSGLDSEKQKAQARIRKYSAKYKK